MLKLRNDFVCTLANKEDKTLLTFKASAGSDLVNNASFEGGGVASAGQALTIFTETEYPFKAYLHYVYIDGQRYAIGNVTKSYRRTLGASGRLKKIYILELS
jgi:hypothetical protein